MPRFTRTSWFESLEHRRLLHSGHSHAPVVKPPATQTGTRVNEVPVDVPVSQTIVAVEDAHVKGGSSASTNYGAQPEMFVRQDASAENTRFAYLRFTTSSLAGTTVESAKFRIYGVSTLTSDVIPLRVDSAGNTWSESTITFNNRPTIASSGTALGTMPLDGTPRWHEVDVTSVIRAAAQRRDASVTLAISGVSNSWSTAKINSSEAMTNRPTLVVNGSGSTPQNPQPLTWSQSASIGQAREESVTFDLGGKMYVIGGYDNATTWTATTRSDRYDPATNTWTRIGNAPTKITHAGVAVDEAAGVAYLAGGYIGDFPAPAATTVVWKYTAATDAWTQIKPLPAARGAGGAALIGQVLYFFGGGDSSRTTDHTTTWALNLANSNANWAQRADMLVARNHFGAAAVNGMIYAIGGQTGLEAAAVNMSHVERYNPSTNRWESVAALPRVLSHFTGSTDVYKGRYIFIAGGEQPHNVAMADVYMYDTQTNTWATMTSLPAARRATSGMIIGDRFYVGNGYNRSLGFSATFWSTDLSVLLLP